MCKIWSQNSRSYVCVLCEVSLWILSHADVLQWDLINFHCPFLPLSLIQEKDQLHEEMCSLKRDCGVRPNSPFNTLGDKMNPATSCFEIAQRRRWGNLCRIVVGKIVAMQNQWSCLCTMVCAFLLSPWPGSWLLFSSDTSLHSYCLYGCTQEFRRVGSSCLQADQNVLGWSPSSSGGGGGGGLGHAPPGKFWENGAKSCNWCIFRGV